MSDQTISKSAKFKLITKKNKSFLKNNKSKTLTADFYILSKMGNKEAKSERGQRQGIQRKKKTEISPYREGGIAFIDFFNFL